VATFGISRGLPPVGVARLRLNEFPSLLGGLGWPDRPDPLDRIEQFAAADVLDAARVQVEGAVAVIEGRLMRHQDIDNVKSQDTRNGSRSLLRGKTLA